MTEIFSFWYINPRFKTTRIPEEVAKEVGKLFSTGIADLGFKELKSTVGVSFNVTIPIFSSASAAGIACNEIPTAKRDNNDFFMNLLKCTGFTKFYSKS